jgi:hypothetical protein
MDHTLGFQEVKQFAPFAAIEIQMSARSKIARVILTPVGRMPAGKCLSIDLRMPDNATADEILAACVESGLQIDKGCKVAVVDLDALPVS